MDPPFSTFFLVMEAIHLPVIIAQALSKKSIVTIVKHALSIYARTVRSLLNSLSSPRLSSATRELLHRPSLEDFTSLTKLGFKIFLDSEAQFDIHDLEMIVENTGTLHYSTVIIVSE